MGAKAFGVQSPTQGEDAVSWQTWSDGAAGVPTISGDADWGKLSLQLAGAEGRSAVYDLGAAIANYGIDKDSNTRADPPTPGCYEEAAA